ncbi:hypothetical protein CNR22_23565 [Sphingobacteriaceae bacterium]|nr:hypothetical protein CNR22_23565 [Sphingobacteriaceae bacterium]
MSFLKKIFGVKSDSNKENSARISENSDKELSDREKILCQDLGYSLEDALLLKRRSAGEINQFEFEYVQEDDKPPCIFVSDYEKGARKMVKELREQFIAEGKFIYLGGYQASGGQYKVVLIDTNDPYEILRHAETNGINYGLETEDIITRLKTWDEKYGLHIYGISHDYLDLKFLAKEFDSKSLAAEIFEFCPDTEDVDEVEKKLKKNGELDLWWD